jgi:hypothetical protein
MHAAFCASIEAQWGTIKGQVILDGDIPRIPLLVKKGDLANKDAAICAAHDIPDEKLVVDPKTKGIANIVIYLAKKPVNVHPNLAQSKDKEVKIDQKGCLYVPHVMLVRTDQRVRVFSDDAIFHSTHTHPIKNDLENFVMAPNDRSGVVLKPMKLAEKVPTKVTCDIHPWTSAYLMVLDHPYAAITDEKGHFEIAHLPVGIHEFKVWHESSGFLEKKRTIRIQEGMNEQKPLMYSASQILK